VVVAESGGRVVAWASLNSFNLRHCYDHVADISVYVERSWRGKGVGRMLLARLVELGRSLSFHKLVLAASPPTSPASPSTSGWGSSPWVSIGSRVFSTACGSTCSSWSSFL
jgi:L-amino acid N-acyltransferase YncA